MDAFAYKNFEENDEDGTRLLSAAARTSNSVPKVKLGGEKTFVYILTSIFAFLFVVLPLLVKKGPNRGVIKCSIMVALFAMWLFWVTIYIAQMNPLIGPRVSNDTLLWLGYKWGNDPEKLERGLGSPRTTTESSPAPGDSKGPFSTDVPVTATYDLTLRKSYEKNKKREQNLWSASRKEYFGNENREGKNIARRSGVTSSESTDDNLGKENVRTIKTTSGDEASRKDITRQSGLKTAESTDTFGKDNVGTSKKMSEVEASAKDA